MSVTLKVAETSPKFVGRGIALVDPRVMEEAGLTTGDVIEIAGKKKSYVPSGQLNLRIMARVLSELMVVPETTLELASTIKSR
jgi:hypothetical protein